MNTDKSFLTKNTDGHQTLNPHGRRLNKHLRLRLILALIAAAALSAAAAIFAWTKGAFLPGWIQWEEKTLEQPEGDDSPSLIALSNRHLTVQKNGTHVWQSPENILVQDFLWCDINHDGTNELILLCWRIGRYGPAKPYWIKNDERTWSQHIYIYQWKNSQIRPLWMASDIGMDVLSFNFNETDRLIITETTHRQTTWDWLTWGLTFQKQLPPPN